MEDVDSLQEGAHKALDLCQSEGLSLAAVGIDGLCEGAGTVLEDAVQGPLRVFLLLDDIQQLHEVAIT